MVKQGFTLIELMIVVAIIAILAAIAYPSYTAYTIRTNRADAQSELMFIAQRMTEYKGVNGSFNGATVQKLYGQTTIPRTKALYDVSFEPSAVEATKWTLVAKPKVSTMQKDNGWLCLNYKSQRYWEKGVNSCNGLSATSNWDGK
ncbi:MULTISPECIES: type IV pilin protein [Acinetobacter]|jgi:type IV pilus assembly protein PilE|uniref:type IV pilin protein n=1 Tax=Acinetobacter TaxID=469 RepID=UPI000900104E|nr:MULTISPECIES: type IV pilin protein [Acinetobacter]EAM8864545.1 prepilin-type N-terminal cleavage/methylation domain-containing protein [Salmonella enterica]OIU85394.1 pilus assembly protein PilE [Acinetobacter sp. AR2-3]